MKTYTVYYKKPSDFFWKKIKNVEGDSFIPNESARAVPMGPNYYARFFMLADKTRIELDCSGLIVKFSKERFQIIQDKMSAESGGKI